jgi:hypothetical protein
MEGTILSNQKPAQSPAGEAGAAEPAIPVKVKAAPLPAVRYLGFRTTADGREYSMRVTEGFDHRHFVLLIPHEVFATREARFQDAPDLCFARLQRDLAADPAMLPDRRLVLTTRELLDYRLAHDPRSPNRKR